jgi:HlyD family secretion protein
MKRRTRWIVAGVVVALGVGGFIASRNRTEVTEVQVTSVGRADLQAKVSANGKVQAQRKVDISATIAGQVTHLAVKEGDRVKKGQLLLQIDPVSPRAQARSAQYSTEALQRDLQSAEASLAQAKADYQRAENNHKNGIIAVAEMERARTTMATAEAAVLAIRQRIEQSRATFEGARDLLAKTTVLAPMDGTITAKRVEEGEVAVIGIQNSPGTVLLTISDMSVVEAEMEVDETSIPSVKMGQEARVRIDAYPNQTFTGEVTEVGSSPIVKTTGATGTEAIKFKVKIRIKNPPETVKPGLSVQADILTGFRAQALVIPIQSLVLKDIERKPGETPKPGEPRDEEGVYLMDNGKTRFQKIKTGLLGELDMEVIEGLKGGETLITGPFKALRAMKPGDSVKLEKPKKDDKKAAG